jgi:uncharacterized membrane protein
MMNGKELLACANRLLDKAKKIRAAGKVKELIAIADRLLPKSQWIRAVWLASLVFSLVLLLLPLIVKLNGRPHADWEQFLGRFHPLAVHLPIGFLVLVPLLELAGFYRPALREAAAFVLGLSFLCSLGALTLGFLLAYGGGNTGAVVTRHMWGGVALTIGVLVCLLARPFWESDAMPHVYPWLLTCVLLVLMYTAHQGGTLTHGNNYLFEYLPAPVKHLLRLGDSADAAPPGSFYAKHIHPILDANCVSCHDGASTKGGLRLDSYAQLMRGGKDGAVVAAGNPGNSLLLHRVTLSPSDKQFMPAEGKPPLKPEEIAWLTAWIQQGASPTAIKLTGIAIEDAPADLPIKPVGDYSALMPEIAQMANGQGAKLVPVSHNASDGLILNTVDIAPTFNDAQLAALVKFAPYIVEAELGRTAVTNASFDTLAKFTNLRALHLEGTAVTGDGISKLAGLSQLTYLNLSGTKVTAAAAAQIQSLKNLRHVYLYNTPAQPAPTAAAMQPIARSAQ